MPLPERIITYVLKHYPLSYTKLEGIVLARGFTLDELLQALETVHKDKRVKQTVRGDDIMYSPAMAPAIKEPGSHLTWIRDNYVHVERPPLCVCKKYQGCEHCIPFFDPKTDSDLTRLIMTRDEYKAEASGRVYTGKKHGRKGKQSTERNTGLSPVQRSLLLAQ